MAGRCRSWTVCALTARGCRLRGGGGATKGGERGLRKGHRVARPNMPHSCSFFPPCVGGGVVSALPTGK